MLPGKLKAKAQSKKRLRQRMQNSAPAIVNVQLVAFATDNVFTFILFVMCRNNQPHSGSFHLVCFFSFNNTDSMNHEATPKVKRFPHNHAQKKLSRGTKLFKKK